MSQKSTPAQEERIESSIDQLVPEAQQGWHKALVALLVVGLTIAFGVLLSEGYVYPYPSASESGPGNRPPIVIEGTTMQASTTFRNLGGRTLAVENVHVRFPGANVVDTHVVDEAENAETTSRNMEESFEVEPGEEVTVYIEFSPFECVDDQDPATVELTVQVAGLSLPFSRTIALKADTGYMVEGVEIEVEAGSSDEDSEGDHWLHQACLLIDA